MQLHAIISGVVQGVSFRFYTRQQANALGIVGWVRNLADGNVEVMAVGSIVQLQALLKWLHRGPSWARVEQVKQEITEESEEFQDFKILEDY